MFVFIFKQDTTTRHKKPRNLAAVACDQQPLVIEPVFAKDGEKNNTQSSQQLFYCAWYKKKTELVKW